jgi:mRNA interferase HigB
MLIDFSTKYPAAQNPLTSWWTVCKKNDFSSFNDLKLIFDTADMVAKCVIFNIGGGKFRLIVRVNFSAHRMWIKYIRCGARYTR